MPKNSIRLLRCFAFVASWVLFVVGRDGVVAKISGGTGTANANANAIARSSSRKLFHDEIPRNVIETTDPNMVDFVVAGFQKCGTTYLQNKILYQSKRVFIPHHETHFLQNDKYAEFLGEFENVTKSTNHDKTAMITGYKSPFVLGHHRSLRNLEALFPDIRMVITLRHPILAFESLYNYKLRQSPEPLPPVKEFVGLCGELCPTETELEDAPMESRTATEQGQGCLDEVHWCTGVMNYHKYLSRLGLTPMNTLEELELLGHHRMSIHDFSGSSSKPNPRGVRGGIGIGSQKQQQDDSRLFLIEIGQFDNRVNQSMAEDVNADLERFLGLETGDLPRPPPRSGDERPKVSYSYPTGYEEYILNICDVAYKPMRDVLLDSSRKASRWIKEYLLHPSNSERVIVSNIDIFEQLLEGWEVDPCLNEDESSM